MPPWSGIAESGGIHAWVVGELKARELWDGDVDTSTLSDRERKKYKARREEERRVRKVLEAHAWQAFRGAHLVHLGRGVFFHDTPDVDRYDIPQREERLAENELPDIADAGALAQALSLTVPQLRWLAFHREVDTGTHYQRWHVPKRDGSLRLISAPKPLLKQAQRWIAQNVTERLPVHGAAHGFLIGRSILSNARVHAGAATLVKFDIKDFYPTVTMLRVKGLLRKAGYGEQVATVLAMLCTEAPREVLEIRGKPHYVASGPRSLPQGAPTSPSITNTLCLRLDARLTGIARSFGMLYTRYADDLTFSSSARDVPLGKLKAAVRRVLEQEGFAVHPGKTRILRGGRRQTVTGLVVNPAPGRPEARVPRKVRRQLRAALHNWAQGKQGEDNLDRLAGLAAYVYMTDPQEGRRYLDQIATLRSKEAP